MGTLFRFGHELLSNFADLIFPALCLGCGRSLSANEKLLCTHCRVNLPETKQHRELYSEGHINKFAGKVPVAFVASFMYFTKGGIVQKLIHQIKYKGQKEAAKELAGWYGYQLKTECDLVNSTDMIVGVPLHKSRFNQRGYNQADWIAEGLSEALNIPMRTDVLIRKRFKSSQTRKNRMARWDNVKSVFDVPDYREVADKNIIIVDDVLTTGATIEACAIELLKAGCRSIGVLTIAATHH